MTELTLKIELKSDALIGTGEGWGGVIDSDVVFDDTGLPYIPAKRVKGCLRESALEITEMFEFSKLDDKISGYIKELFGDVGNIRSGPLEFSNCYLKDYTLNREWLDWARDTYIGIFSKELVLKTFTSIKQYTAIEKEGIAKEHSLRTFRVLKKGNVFFGKVSFSNESDTDLLQFLAFSVKNMRYLGTNRNRGMGSIQCKLFDSQGNDLIEEHLSKLEHIIRGK